MTKLSKQFTIFLGLIAMFGLACTEETDEGAIGSAKPGEACSQTADCVAGYTCESKVCTIASSVGNPNKGLCCDATVYLKNFPGGSCDTPVDCGSDLVCGTQGACATSAGKAEGESCALSVDCAQGLACHGKDTTCQTPGAGLAGLKDVGDDCDLTDLTDCRRPYVCNVANVKTPTCVKLPFFTGPDCSLTESETGSFRVYHQLPQDTLGSCCDKTRFEQNFTDTTCDDAVAACGEGSLCGAKGTCVTEFYRLPFPNDIRRNADGSIDMQGHPEPGPLFGIDVVRDMLDSIENDLDGFALNSPIFFRLTDLPNTASICLDEGGEYPTPAEGESFCAAGAEAEASVYLVNVEQGDSDYNQRVPIEISLGSTRAQYLCQNSIGLIPTAGTFLKPNTTYAAVITSDLKDSRANTPIRDQDFAKVMQGSASGLSDHVIQATEPLLTWAADKLSDAQRDAIVAATVFTTGDPGRQSKGLRDAVHAATPPPVFGEAFNCACLANPPDVNCPGLPSAEPTDAFVICQLPPGGTEGAPPGRSCSCNAHDANGVCTSPKVDAKYDEVRGIYSAPIFQSGTRPYFQANAGGLIDIDSPTSQSKRETMCYTLTVPKSPQTRPTGGWPVLIYGHGTDGSNGSFIQDTLGGGATLPQALADLGFAVISFDNVLHGPRAIDFTSANALDTRKLVDTTDLTSASVEQALGYVSPGSLFFNLVNPIASRDNVLQGSADLFHLTHLLTTEAEATTPTLNVPGMDITFDKNNIFYMGHSQGTTIVYPYLEQELNLKGVILSGAGADLSLSILNKTKPLDIGQVIGTLFAEQNLGRIHPVLGMFAQVFGPADAVGYARNLLTTAPSVGPSGSLQGILMFSGIDDSFTPIQTQEALIKSVGLPKIASGETVSANKSIGSKSLTIGVVQLTPESGDGHFVMQSHSQAAAPVTHFLQTALTGTPEIQR
jgi:hypothetical protein